VARSLLTELQKSSQAISKFRKDLQYLALRLIVVRLHNNNYIVSRYILPSVRKEILTGSAPT